MIRLALLLLLIVAPTPPPPDAQARWLSDGIAELRWTQQSNATHVCIYLRTDQHLLGCMESGAGEHVITWPNGPTDGYDHPQLGDAFWIEELRRGEGSVEVLGKHGPVPIGFRYWLPIVGM